jgi:hypothetical protein
MGAAVRGHTTTAMDGSPSARVGVVTAAFFIVATALYTVWSPHTETSAFHVLSGDYIHLENGTSVRAYGLQMPTVLMQASATVVFFSFAACTGVVFSCPGFSAQARKLWSLLLIAHIFGYLSLGVFHVSPALLLLSLAIIAGQLYLGKRVRHACTVALDFSTVRHRLCLIAVDCLLAWTAYLFLATLLLFILAAQGIQMHTHDEVQNGGVFVVPAELVAAAKNSATVSVGAFIFYAIVAGIFVNGSAAQTMNLAITVVLLLQTKAKDIVFFSLAVLVVALSASIAHSGALSIVSVQCSSAAWVERYTEGIFADTTDRARLPTFAPAREPSVAAVEPVLPPPLPTFAPPPPPAAPPRPRPPPSRTNPALITPVMPTMIRPE